MMVNHHRESQLIAGAFALLEDAHPENPKGARNAILSRPADANQAAFPFVFVFITLTYLLPQILQLSWQKTAT
ncbi:MAG: hypothetical protein NPIRA06_04820 [Nitrospirales bacterium]|nr:MAG: hypothetical protein NPIRA06_04820 [Nitrospirales bacterium]